jgi:hypothetical protein
MPPSIRKRLEGAGRLDHNLDVQFAHGNVLDLTRVEATNTPARTLSPAPTQSARAVRARSRGWSGLCMQLHMADQSRPFC